MTTELREVAQQALTALRVLDDNYEECEGEDGEMVACVPLSLLNLCSESIEQLRAALEAEPQEPACQRYRAALLLWKRASNNAEECELDEYAHYAIPMPLFCDADEATDEALKGESE